MPAGGLCAVILLDGPGAGFRTCHGLAGLLVEAVGWDGGTRQGGSPLRKKSAGRGFVFRPAEHRQVSVTPLRERLCVSAPARTRTLDPLIKSQKDSGHKAIQDNGLDSDTIGFAHGFAQADQQTPNIPSFSRPTDPDLARI